MTISLRESPFNPYEEVQQFQQNQAELAGKQGATALFIGTMRDFNEGQTVRKMTLEYYPGMTEKRLAQIVTEASARWGFLDALVVHRVGEIKPNDTIVLVAVWSSHRGAAFDACRHIIETLKHQAPFWKKETLPDRARWVEQNTAG